MFFYLSFPLLANNPIGKKKTDYNNNSNWTFTEPDARLDTWLRLTELILTMTL